MQIGYLKTTVIFLPCYWGYIYVCIYTHVCVVLTVYHDLNVCYYGGLMLNKRNTGQNKCYHIKQRLLQFFTDVNDLIMKRIYLCILTQATIKCAFLRYKKVVLLLFILWGNPNLFLDLKYNSLEHAETKKYIYLDIYFVKENVWFLKLSLEQKYCFKFERNKDLTFIVIIIDIDWYKKNYRDHFMFSFMVLAIFL